MMTVKEVGKLCAVSPRTLRHYDAIGLLRPTEITEGGYRLYDHEAVERLGLILLYRELGFSLGEIKTLLDAPEGERNRVLEKQLELLKRKKQGLEDRILLTQGILIRGVKDLTLTAKDRERFEDHATQAEILWGKTEAYGEYRRRAADRAPQDEKALGRELLELFRIPGALRGTDPASPEAQGWVEKLRGFITANYYTCTLPILRGLGQMYGGGGSMTENIDKTAGEGTGAFAGAAVEIYCARTTE